MLKFEKDMHWVVWNRKIKKNSSILYYSEELFTNRFLKIGKNISYKRQSFEQDSLLEQIQENLLKLKPDRR